MYTQQFMASVLVQLLTRLLDLPTPANVSTRGSICHCHCNIPPDSSDYAGSKATANTLMCINAIHRFYYKNLYAYIYI